MTESLAEKFKAAKALLRHRAEGHGYPTQDVDAAEAELDAVVRLACLRSAQWGHNIHTGANAGAFVDELLGLATGTDGGDDG